MGLPEPDGQSVLSVCVISNMDSRGSQLESWAHKRGRGLFADYGSPQSPPAGSQAPAAGPPAARGYLPPPIFPSVFPQGPAVAFLPPF